MICVEQLGGNFQAGSDVILLLRNGTDLRTNVAMMECSLVTNFLCSSHHVGTVLVPT